jgi:hypothetical protein
VNNNRKHPQPRALATCTTALLLCLSGCGGSSDPLSYIDPASKYVGTWTSDCEETRLVSDSHPDDRLHAVYEITFHRRHSDTLRFKTVYKVYRNSGCTGSSLATHTNDSDDNTYLIEGHTTVKGVPVDKIVVNMAALGGPSSASGPVVRDGIRYPGDYFISSVHNQKDVVSVSATGMRFGTGDAVDGDGYPHELESDSSLHRSF